MKHPSKYEPHQGKRERLRRKLGGFHNWKRKQKLAEKYGGNPKHYL